MLELAGRTAVVTGAAGGIGRALARRLGVEDMNVVLADVENEALGSTVAELAAAGIAVEGVVTDVGDPRAAEHLASVTEARFGPADLLVCNAGVAGESSAALWETSPEEWQRVFGANTFGITNVLGAFLPTMVASGDQGHVVISASMASFLRGPLAAHHFASKHAALSIAESLRLQLAAIEAPIGVSVLCTGAVSTRILALEVAHQRRRGMPISAEEERARLAPLAPGTPGVLSPDAVAEVVLEAVRADRFHVFTHEASIDSALGRMHSLAAELEEARGW